MIDKKNEDRHGRKLAFWEAFLIFLFKRSRLGATMQVLQEKLVEQERLIGDYTTNALDHEKQVEALVKIILDAATLRATVIPISVKGVKFALFTVHKEAAISHLQIPTWLNFQLTFPLQFPGESIAHAHLNIYRDGTLKLREFTVTPERRNTKLGYALMAQVMARAKILGDRWVPMSFELADTPEQAAAMHLFKKFFRKVRVENNLLLVEY